jgi:transcription elongation factor GreB
VSKAFTNEETADTPIIVRARAPLPAGVPNYVTARGLAQLRAELADLEHERAAREGADEDGDRDQVSVLGARIAELAARIGSAELIDVTAQGADEVRFGATVRVRDGDGKERQYEIVGVDEADARAGKVAFVSPVAAALLGRRVGETVELRSPRGEEELEIVEIHYRTTTP